MDSSHVIAIGVGVNLLLALAHHLFTKPAQQKQLDSIEAAVNDIVAQVTGKELS